MFQPRLVNVEPMGHLKLRITYETGEVKIFDVSPYANGSWFKKLKEDAHFRTVESGTTDRTSHHMNCMSVVSLLNKPTILF